jgi:hypothetical protein
MRIFLISAVSLLNLILGIYYFFLISRKKIRPALAMWVFFFLAVALSLFTYLKEGDFSIWDNILNTADLFFVGSVTLTIFFFGDRSSRFNRFDIGCLAVVIGIVIFWMFTHNHFVTNLLVQGILVIAYFPVINRMVRSGENHESYLIWGGMLLAAGMALPVSSGDLALVYTLRAIISILLLMGLMFYTDWKRGRKTQSTHNMIAQKREETREERRFDENLEKR